MLVKGSGQKLCRAIGPTRPQFVDIVAKLLDYFDWRSLEQFAEKAGRSRSALSQSKVFPGKQQQQ